MSIEMNLDARDRPHRAKRIMKEKDGSLRVTQYNGETYVIGPDDIEMQVFIVYMMIAG